MDPRLIFPIFLVLATSVNCNLVNVDHETREPEDKEKVGRDGKLFNVFTIVRFPNDPCFGSSNRNGTCYTESECSSRGGGNSGSCAQGFGVCCTFIAGCGASVAENCTYFESSGGEIGACSLEICPCSSGIRQMRLDFSQMVITGPVTSTV